MLAPQPAAVNRKDVTPARAGSTAWAWLPVRPRGGRILGELLPAPAAVDVDRSRRSAQPDMELHLLGGDGLVLLASGEDLQTGIAVAFSVCSWNRRIGQGRVQVGQGGIDVQTDPLPHLGGRLRWIGAPREPRPDPRPEAHQPMLGIPRLDGRAAERCSAPKLA